MTFVTKPRVHHPKLPVNEIGLTRRDTLIDLGRLEANNLELQHEAVDARALLSAVGSTIVPSANRRNVSLDISVAENTPKIWGDTVRLRQILLNLTDNAVKFTGEAGTVSLTAAPGELEVGGPSGLGTALFATTRPAIVLTVRDTGMGIEGDNLSRIFDAFYQVDAGTTRAHGGAGLGLSIAQSLVHQHGGHVVVRSERGHGSSFRVLLPTSAAATSGGDSDELAASPSTTILLAEDEVVAVPPVPEQRSVAIEHAPAQHDVGQPRGLALHAQLGDLGTPVALCPVMGQQRLGARAHRFPGNQRDDALLAHHQTGSVEVAGDPRRVERERQAVEGTVPSPYVHDHLGPVEGLGQGA